MQLSSYSHSVTPETPASISPPARHTPGPWSVGELDEPTGQINVMAGEHYVLAALPGLDAQQANAQLAAEAPRMLEMLRALEASIAAGLRAGLICDDAIPLSLLRAVRSTIKDASNA